MRAFIDKWQGTEFQSNTGLTEAEEFATFGQKCKKALGHELQDEFEVTRGGDPTPHTPNNRVLADTPGARRSDIFIRHPILRTFVQ